MVPYRTKGEVAPDEELSKKPPKYTDDKRLRRLRYWFYAWWLCVALSSALNLLRLARDFHWWGL